MPIQETIHTTSLLLRKGCLSRKQYIQLIMLLFQTETVCTSRSWVWLHMELNIVLWLWHWKCWWMWLATKIVFSLAKAYWIRDIEFMLIIGTLPFNQGYCIYVNNWYTSFELCANIQSLNTDIIHILCKDCKGLLKEVIGEKHNLNKRSTWNNDWSTVTQQCLWLLKSFIEQSPWPPIPRHNNNNI